MISISDAVFQTQLFIIIFVLGLILSLKIRRPLNFDNSLTEELKGFAMLAIVFSHIGYFLVSDQRFLFPLSVSAGVGVNLFLFLSGFGLALSQAKKPLSMWKFYRSRLTKLLMPLWIVLTILFAFYNLFLHQTYPLDYILKSFLGFFQTSNPYYDIDSPLWYLTLILYFYLIFPIFFRAKNIIWSGIGMFALTFVLLKFSLPISEANIHLYQLHFLAFPLGVMAAGVKSWDKINTTLSFLSKMLIRLPTLIILSLLFAYFAIHSGVGEGQTKEQAISLVSTILAVMIFLLKDLRFRILNLIGKYSFEIYLIHWPILFSFDHFFKFLPAAAAVVFYLLEFVILGILLQKVSSKITKIIT